MPDDVIKEVVFEKRYGIINTENICSLLSQVGTHAVSTLEMSKVVKLKAKYYLKELFNETFTSNLYCPVKLSSSALS